MTKTTIAEAAKALRDQKGFVTHAARQLGISRQRLHTLIKNHPTVKEAVDDAREEMKDFAESKLYQGISEGNTALIIFYAKTQMKDRGYVERQEVTGKDGGPLETLDYSKLTDNQLAQIAAGKSVVSVIKDDSSIG